MSEKHRSIDAGWGQSIHEKEKLRLGNETFEVDVAPITLICKSPEIPFDVQSDTRVFIDSIMTVQHTRTVKKLHPRTEKLFKMVFPQYDKKVTPENVRRDGTGMQHVLGLVDLSLLLMDRNQPFGWRYPEAYLHPSAQAALADVLIDLATITPLDVEI